MDERDRLCVVQFIHPGGEHQPHGDDKRWNERDHRRKFLSATGRYVEGHRLQSGKIVFWGEWEPESRVVARYTDSDPDSPSFLYEPYFVDHADDRWRQNTDPFVFGSQFFYTGCMSLGPTQLRYLAAGSLVLFGSCRERSRFVIDTAFVVRDFIDHSATNWHQQLARAVPDTYKQVTIEPWYRFEVPPERSHRLYRSATYEHRIGEMFSFLPCLPDTGSDHGFARPEIKLDEHVTSPLTQGKRISRDLTISQVAQLWESVVEQVADQGLALGTYARMPGQRAIRPEFMNRTGRPTRRPTC